MARPTTSLNNVTTRKLDSLINSLWTKIKATFFKPISGTTTLVSNTAVKIGTVNGTDVNLKLPTIPAAANNGALQLQINGGTAASKFTANQSTNSTLKFATGATDGTISIDGTDVSIKGLGTAAYKDIPSSGNAGTSEVVLGNDTRLTNSRTPTSHTHGNIANGGTLTDTAAAAAGNDYVVIRDADNSKIQTSTIKGTDVADAVSKKHSHSTLTLSTTAQAYDGSHTLALPSTDPYTTPRTPTSHTHGNIQNAGTLQTNDITIASGDKLVVTDASDSNKVARASVTFDGSTVGKALTQKGTFENVMLQADAIGISAGAGIDITYSGTTATFSANIPSIPISAIEALS